MHSWGPIAANIVSGDGFATDQILFYFDVETAQPTAARWPLPLLANAFLFSVFGIGSWPVYAYQAVLCGLTAVLLILFRTWRGCAKLIKQTADVPALQWIHNLARAFRVSFVAYGVAGAALNMAYFEMLYVFVVLVAIQEQMVKRHFQSVAPTNTADPLSIGAGKRVMTVGRPPMRSMKRPL